MTLLPPLLMVSSKHDCQLYCLNCNIHSQTCVSKNFFWVTLTYRRSISPIMKSIRDILRNKGHPDDRSHRPLNFASHVLLYPTDNSSFCNEPVSNLFLLQGSQVEAISRSLQYFICKLFNDKSLVIRWSPGITTEEAQLCELF